MTNRTLPIKQLLKDEFATTKKHFPLFVKILLIMVAISAGSHIVANIMENKDNGVLTIIGAVLAFGFWILQLITDLGLLRISLSIVDGKKAQVSDLFFTKENVLFRYFLSSTLYGIGAIVGLICFIIPGIVFGLATHFYPYFVLEGQGPIQALKSSISLTKGVRWYLFRFALALGLLNLVGALLLLIGLLFTIPISILAAARIFRHLQKHQG